MQLTKANLIKEKNNMKSALYEIDHTKSPIYTRAVDDTRHKITDSLQCVIDIQAQKGNWDYDPYMMGLLNGLIMAKSICTGKEPEFYSAPKRWGKDYPLFWTRVKWWIFGTPKPVSQESMNVPSPKARGKV